MAWQWLLANHSVGCISWAIGCSWFLVGTYRFCISYTITTVLYLCQAWACALFCFVFPVQTEVTEGKRIKLCSLVRKCICLLSMCTLQLGKWPFIVFLWLISVSSSIGQCPSQRYGESFLPFSATEDNSDTVGSFWYKAKDVAVCGVSQRGLRRAEFMHMRSCILCFLWGFSLRVSRTLMF